MFQRIKRLQKKVSSLLRLPEEIEQLKTEIRSDQKPFAPNQDRIAEYIQRHENDKLTARICREIDFKMGWYKRWCKEIKMEPRLHRKQWEFMFICQALFERGLLAPGKKGLGFAVGTEPLPALFTKYGCEILATDINPDEGEKKGWANGEQLCYGKDSLNTLGICPPEEFDKLVSYREVDMNHIPEDLKGFDFTWSACSFEHLGSIEKGLQFFKNQLKTLKPGGWAIHTTEYNLSSNTDTFEDENVVLFRQQDILKVLKELESEGHYVEIPDFSMGWLPTDYHVDVPPFAEAPHTRLKLFDYVSTSIALIVQKKS